MKHNFPLFSLSFFLKFQCLNSTQLESLHLKHNESIKKKL